jgi:hypothetical protein
MSNDNNRVLTRMGARTVTENELEEIRAAANTVASNLGTGPVSHPDDILDQ